MKKYTLKSIVEKSILLFFFLYVFNSCSPDIELWQPTSDKFVISDIIAKDSLNYSEFNALLVNTQLDGFLAIRGPYTLFLPNNVAMTSYYASKGIKSASDLDIKAQKELVYNHLILANIGSGDIGLGSIREPNALGDKLASEFIGENFETIVINKSAKIIDRDIKAANGVIHEIDKVLEPLTTNVFEVIKSNPSFSLFAKGLELSGISDTLQIIEFQYSEGIDKMVRNQFTILAVPDTIFNRYGINSIDDMINRFTNEPGKLKEINNGFYQFMEYHCLVGSFFLSDFETKLYPILSFNNNVLLTIDSDDYKLNNNSVSEVYTKFFIGDSNIPAKNGAIHIINDILPVINPEASSIIFDTCEQFEIMQGEFYMKYYKKWYDGQNTFENIKWEGDYMQYYYKDHDAPVQINFDGLQMIGFWWLEVTTPKIMKGKYSMTGYVWGGRVCDVYVDGVKVAHIGSTDPDRYEWGEFEWTETTTHKVKMVSTSFSTIFWDTIELTPISD